MCGGTTTSIYSTGCEAYTIRIESQAYDEYIPIYYVTVAAKCGTLEFDLGLAIQQFVPYGV